MDDPRDYETRDITEDTDESDAVAVGPDEVPDVREDAVPGDPVEEPPPPEDKP